MLASHKAQLRTAEWNGRKKKRKRASAEAWSLDLPLIVIVHYDCRCFSLFCQLAWRYLPWQKCAPARSLYSDNYRCISVLCPLCAATFVNATAPCVTKAADYHITANPNLNVSENALQGKNMVLLTARMHGPMWPRRWYWLCELAWLIHWSRG